ncbi:MAG TPA: HAMP domain-containing sensor histidine kinase [Candidatus Nitrosotalea sp.]|nr:HAMP domain-containing sensor histidine kinase [Candidatus Nitrosotalea sp.]
MHPASTVDERETGARPAWTLGMARSMTFLWATGASLVLLTLLVAPEPGSEPQFLGVLIALAYLVALGVRLGERWLPYAAYQLLAALGTLVITLVVYTGGGVGTTYQLFYVWVGMYAFFFFGRTGALLQIGLVVVAAATAYLGPLHAAARTPAPLANLLVLLGTVVAATVVATRFVEQLRRQSRLESELAVSQARAEEADRQSGIKSRMLVAISHEMKTPLNAVLGFSQLLAESGLDPRRHGQVENVSAAARQILDLIGDLLDVATSVVGRLQVASEQVELLPLVDECAAGLKPQLDARQLSLTLSCPPLQVIADRRRLRQVLLNLLSNAVKFTPAGGRIALAAAILDERRVEIRVEDSGVGIAEPDLARVFEEFVQLDPGIRAGGTGLGLAISRVLVHAMQGEISVASSPGSGSVFRVYLPAPAALSPEV